MTTLRYSDNPDHTPLPLSNNDSPERIPENFFITAKLLFPVATTARPILPRSLQLIFPTKPQKVNTKDDFSNRKTCARVAGESCSPEMARGRSLFDEESCKIIPSHRYTRRLPQDRSVIIIPPRPKWYIVVH